jgi:hypothetical protein
MCVRHKAQRCHCFGGFGAQSTAAASLRRQVRRACEGITLEGIVNPPNLMVHFKSKDKSVPTPSLPLEYPFHNPICRVPRE